MLLQHSLAELLSNSPRSIALICRFIDRFAAKSERSGAMRSPRRSRSIHKDEGHAADPEIEFWVDIDVNERIEEVEGIRPIDHRVEKPIYLVRSPVKYQRSLGIRNWLCRTPWS